MARRLVKKRESEMGDSHLVRGLPAFDLFAVWRRLRPCHATKGVSACDSERKRTASPRRDDTVAKAKDSASLLWKTSAARAMIKEL